MKLIDPADLGLRTCIQLRTPHEPTSTSIPSMSAQTAPARATYLKEKFMSDPTLMKMGSMTCVERTTIDIRTLDWWPMEAYSPEATTLPIVQDADNKTWLAQQDESGAWREFIDGQLTRALAPVRWAVPADEMVEALAFG
jgi:hypothetical protein